MHRALATLVIALGLVIVPSHARADELPVAVFDLRPVTSTGQTDLAELRDAVLVSAKLRDRLAATGQVQVVPLDRVKHILGPLYRVHAFDCHESPACLQRAMRALAKRGIPRVVLGTYEVVGDRLQLTLLGVETKTGAFTKVRLLQLRRGGDVDEAAADEAMLAVADVPGAGAPPAPPTPPPDQGGDQTDELAPMPPPPPPPIPDRLQVLGWARLHTAVGLASRSSDPLAPPYDRVTSRNQMYLEARYQRAKKLEAAASGLIEWDVFDHRTAFEANLRELYVGALWDHFAVRVGNQRIAWGKADAISPNDILNPRDLRDPLLTDPELRHTPSFAIRADLTGGVHSLQVVVQPFFVPDRYDLYGSNWAVIQPSSPLPYRGFFRLLSQVFDPTLHDDVQRLFAQTRLPTAPSAGARYTYSGHRLDASLYYHYGYSATPAVALAPDFAQAIGSIDWTTAKPSTLAPVLQLLDAGEQPFTATFVRRHHLGVDGVTTVGPFALKLDAAYETAAVFYRPDLVSFTSPVAQAVGTVEYQSGELGKVVLLEGIYQRIFDPLPAVGLLGYRANTLGAAALVRWRFFDVLEAELHALAVVKPGSIIVQPQLAYHARSGSLIVAVGALLVRGEPLGLGGYYGRNSSVFGSVKLLW